MESSYYQNRTAVNSCKLQMFYQGEGLRVIDFQNLVVLPI